MNRLPLIAGFTLACLATSSGCYDSSALLEQARSAAQRTRLAEVDLGEYHITLPRNPETNALTDLSLHCFGTVPRYNVPVIERQIKAEEYRLRFELIAAVRTAPVEEWAEPNLNRLRGRIAKVVNGILEDAPVNTIGFYDMRVSYR